jgi:hypothetical protein
VEGKDRALVLDPDPPAAQVRCVDLPPELVHPPPPVLELGIDRRLGPPRPQQLGAVRAEVGDRPDRDHRPRLGRAAPADARDHAVAARELGQQLARRLGNTGVGRLLDDRRERAVDVEHDCCASRVLAHRRENLRAER